MTRFIEDHFLPYSCDVDEGTSCEMDHADPNRVLMKFLQRQMGVGKMAFVPAVFSMEMIDNLKFGSCKLIFDVLGYKASVI